MTSERRRTSDTPAGTFSSGQGLPPAAPEPKPERVRPLPGLSFPPDTGSLAQPTQHVVLENTGSGNEPAPQPSPSEPAPALGKSEEHDAWTYERLRRRSTVPPVRREDVDRLPGVAPGSIPPLPLPGGGAFDLVDRSRPSEQLDLLGEMEELYALDDLTGALRYAELVLGREPDNSQARRCADNCRRQLTQLYASKLGDLGRVPVHVLDEPELRWLGLDHRAAFLLSRIDGASTIDEVLDVCGMPRLEALKTLVDLFERGAVRLVPREG